MGQRVGVDDDDGKRCDSHTAIVFESTELEFIFEPQEDGGYHVYAPDLPGLHTPGETLDEAKANAQEALKIYVEGPTWLRGC